ncbi:MAG: hypothetical protein IJU50_00370 [Lachnospiraceae bacterium]|nr:hypothetical protein [Lachnospiraceae bacterium]
MRRRGEKDRTGVSVAYQNKDITAKVMAEHFKGKSFAAFGLGHLPKVADILPTNLPAIEANELKIDNVFVLEDGSWAIVDYESAYRKRNMVKYLAYVARLASRMYNLYGGFRRLRVIIIYTADVRRGSTEPVLDCGAFRLEVEEAFLSGLDSAAIFKRISAKIRKRTPLDEKDLMQLIVYPLTHKGEKAKQDAVGRAVDLAERMEAEEGEKLFTLASICVFADKVIRNEDREMIRRRIEMTRLGREFWEEAMEEGRKQGLEQERLRVVKTMLRKGIDVRTIRELTGLSEKEILRIEKQILNSRLGSRKRKRLFKVF